MLVSSLLGVLLAEFWSYGFKFSQYYFYDGTFSLSFSCKHDRRILLLLTSCKNHAPFLRMVDPLLQATNKINMAFRWETKFFLERKWNATFRGHCERALCGSLFPWFVLRGLAKIMIFCSTWVTTIINHDNICLFSCGTYSCPCFSLWDELAILLHKEQIVTYQSLILDILAFLRKLLKKY